jgi:hypothetical protein
MTNVKAELIHAPMWAPRLIWEMWTRLVTTFHFCHKMIYDWLAIVRSYTCSTTSNWVVMFRNCPIYVYGTRLSTRSYSITTKFMWLTLYTNLHDFPWSCGIALNMHKWLYVSGASVHLSYRLAIKRTLVDMLHEQSQCSKVYVLHSLNLFCTSINQTQYMNNRNCAATTEHKSMWRLCVIEDGVLRP